MCDTSVTVALIILTQDKTTKGSQQQIYCEYKCRGITGTLSYKQDDQVVQVAYASHGM